MTITELQKTWADVPEFHAQTHAHFRELVNADEKLKQHRDYVETNAWGFGERSFWWLWKLIIDDMPNEFKFLEIGVFRGATLSIINLLAQRVSKFSHISGITPLDTSGGVWNSEYRKDIEEIHNQFNPNHCYRIYEGLSQDGERIKDALEYAPYEICYIDGSHTFEDALADLNNYAPMVKTGGYLVIDDCNNDMSMPFGMFQGIDTVTQAKLKWLEINNDFEFVASVVHISVYRRK